MDKKQLTVLCTLHKEKGTERACPLSPCPSSLRTANNPVVKYDLIQRLCFL